MKAKLTAQNLKGMWGTLLLPINNDDSINYQLLNDEIDYLVSAKMDGIYSNGTAGEFHNQAEHEFDKVQEMLSRKCLAGDVRFQVGVSHPSPIISLERLKRSIHLMPDAFQVILPDWVITTNEEQVIFLQRMAEAASGIPIVLYNPPHAKLVLKPEDYFKFKTAVPNLIGIKVAGGNEQWFDEMRNYATHLSVFVPGHLLASGVQQKVGAGAYSNVACISPKGAQWWWDLMQTDMNKALSIQEQILQFFDECIIPYIKEGFSNPALDKFLAAIGGWCPIGTRLRWPYKWIPVEDVKPAREIAKKYIAELLAFNDD
ncbi:MAG: dihydrodipicolinate synthase family protein [Chitinophagaceae bacterium]